MSNSTLQPYLFFNGRCDEAVEFYKKALGAQVDFLMRYSDAPQPPAPGMIPPGFEGKVMHATLRVGGDVLMVSDGNTVGPNFSGFTLSLSFPNEAAARSAFDALAAGGRIKMPIGKTFWSPCFGMLDDRFGVGWMISVPAPQG